MNIKLVVTDLDNTLLRRDKAISEYTKSVFNNLRKHDILTAFATSRSVRASARFRAMITPDINITSGGAIATMNDKTLFRAAIDIKTANAVAAVCAELGLSMSDVVAFGDDHNDIEMLRECGFGVAVANAIDEVKAVADYICGDCDEDGVAKWLEENVLCN